MVVHESRCGHAVPPRGWKPAWALSLARVNGHAIAIALVRARPLRAQAGRAASKPDAAPLQGTVTKVTDGDSLWFTPTGQPHIVVRLRDIDAPEICQAWGPEARQALADMVQGKPAVLQTRGRDVHGRVLGALSVDEQDVSLRLVQDGHAWSTRSRWDQGPLVKQERMARALRRGLHAQADAVMPRTSALRTARTQAGCRAVKP
jgi:endonuclease YncB( thermonuclease family)